MRENKRDGNALPVDEFNQFTFQEYKRVERSSQITKGNEKKKLCDRCLTEHWALDPCPVCGEEE